jgi:polysaccharide biosynthesis/export protein
MRLNSFQRIIAKAVYYCAIFALLSMTATVEIAYAQTTSSSTLEGLVERLEELGGKAGRLGPLGSGPTIDSARESAVKGIARSPFSRNDSEGHPELNTRLTTAELLLIDRYCHGTANKLDIQVLDVMEEFSHIERDYCGRVSRRILQIGYNVFDGVLTPELLVNGTISDDYVLGIGDELVLTYEGKKNDSLTIWIDREGRLTHKDLGRFPAAGKSFGQLRQELQRATEKTQFGTTLHVSMGAVRLITVRVTGEVRKPGLHQITGLSSIFDAISLAGGVRKTGSLRRIQVKRDDRIFWLDAYELMFPEFGGQDLVLRDGDQILVPSLGKTIAVAGNVKREGVFELAEGQMNISAQDALELAGGPIRSKGNVLIKLSFDALGRETSGELSATNVSVGDGDILLVKRRNKSKIGSVSIVGHVSNPGEKSFQSVRTVQALLMRDNSFLRDPYLLFGILETTDPATFSRRKFPLNLKDIVDGRTDYQLRDKDRLIVLGQEEIKYLSSDEVRKTIAENSDVETKGADERAQVKVNEKAQSLTEKLLSNVGSKSTSSLDPLERANLDERIVNSNSNKVDRSISQYSCSGLRSLATVLRFTRSGRFASVAQALGGAESIEFVNPRTCPDVFEKNPDLLPFVLEHSVAVNGEVRAPGAYPVVTNTSVASLVAVTGGLTLDADISQIEITEFKAGSVKRRIFDFLKSDMREVLIGPSDVLRFNPLFKARDNGPVLLSGEFSRPGLYDIKRGERLSEVIARAGGLTVQAYPYGAVFTRDRVRNAQQIAYKRAARELKSAAIFAAGKAGGAPESFAALQKLTDEVVSTEALGRVVIEADPTVLSVRPELDSVLEPGDKIFMPKRPNSVLVVGDVLNPGALQFISGSKADTYINQAGGMRQSADEDRMFLIYPNGVAQPISVSVWNYNPVQVPPGSTLVVPMDPAPLDVFSFAKDMTALISQMAITAASLAVIGNN